jgi:hypothetical protein
LSEKKLVGRSAVIALALICMVLAVSLVVSVSLQNSQIVSLQAQKAQVQSWLDGNKTDYEDELANKSEMILSLKSEISRLAGVFLNVTGNYGTVNELMIGMSNWVNRTVLLEGNLSFYYLSIEEIANGGKWNYRLNSNGTEFLLWWEPDGFSSPSYDGLNAILIGIVKQTTTYVLSDSSYRTVFYIDAEKIIPI